MTEFTFFEAKPQFLSLSEAEVWDAINRDDDSDVAAEVTRLACMLWQKFQTMARQNDGPPPYITKISVQCPIERVAVIIMLGYIETETGSVPRVTQH